MRLERAENVVVPEAAVFRAAYLYIGAGIRARFGGRGVWWRVAEGGPCGCRER